MTHITMPESHHWIEYWNEPKVGLSQIGCHFS